MQYFQYIVGTLAVRRSTLLLSINWSAVLHCRSSESSQGKKAGSGDFEGWAAAAILTQRAAAERQTNHY